MIATSIQICIYRAKEIDQHRSYAINVVSIGQNARDEEDGLKKMVLWRRKRKEEGGEKFSVEDEEAEQQSSGGVR